MKTIFFFLISLSSLSLSAQCFEDRHDTSLASGWTSCTPSLNPNPAHGMSHWIAYDLGENRKLNTVQLWNANNPTTLTRGVKTLIVDYSSDGQSWESYGTYEVAMAEASSFYEGVLLFDFEDLTTRHLLFTLAENHGGECYGFSELKIQADTPVSSDDLTESLLSVYPIPASDEVYVEYQGRVSEGGTLSLLNAAGVEVSREAIRISDGNNLHRIDLSALPSGQYLVRLQSENMQQTSEVTVITP